MHTTSTSTKNHKEERNESKKIAVITGANSGIGFETAKILATQNIEVILAVRDQKRGNEAKKRILEVYPPARLSVEQLDLASLSSIHRFAARLRSRTNQLNILINNAGVSRPAGKTTKDGFDYIIGVNHLGHFALTGLLLPLLLACKDSRIITASSIMHRFAKIDKERPLTPVSVERSRPTYAQSKLANLVFALELQRRLQKSQKLTKSLAVHPGYVKTQMTAAHQSLPVLKRWMRRIQLVFAQTPYHGALTLVHGALADVQGGEFIGPRLGLWGKPHLSQPHSQALDPLLASRLWNESEKVTGITYPL